MDQVVALLLTFLSLQTKNFPFMFMKVFNFFADSSIIYAVVAVLSQSLFRNKTNSCFITVCCTYDRIKMKFIELQYSIIRLPLCVPWQAIYSLHEFQFSRIVLG